MLPEFRELSKARPGTITVSGLSRVHKAHFLSALWGADSAESGHESGVTLVLAESENEAMRLCDDIAAFGGAAVVFPARDLNLTAAVSSSSEYEHRRIAVLAQLSSDDPPRIVIATPEAAAQTAYAPAELARRIITVGYDGEVNTADLLKSLTDMGYTRVDMVECPAQFSQRGSVIDVYSVCSALPARIDLWGDSVDNLAYFDPETQRSVERVEQIRISPAEELSGDTSEDTSGDTPSTPGSLFDYVQEVIVCEQTNCNEQFRAAWEQHKEDLMLAAESGRGNLGTPLMLSKAEYEAVPIRAHLCTFARGTLARGHGSGVTLAANAATVSPWNGDYSQLKSDLSDYVKRGYSVVMFAGTEKAARSLALDLRDDGLPADYSTRPKKVYARHIFVTAGVLSAGFDYPEAKCAAITTQGINRRAADSDKSRFAVSPKPPKSPKKRKRAETIRALTEINVGDYIVHDKHGIGIFEGVTKLTNDGISKDYIKLKYAGADVLYIPVTQLDMIARYIGNTESLRLTKLNTDTWARTKAKVKAATEELAQELIELYSARMRARGYKFGSDTREQIEFENRFAHIETADQLTCIDQLKGDMQREQPMDRLLCGDVGFGKTEVALRGAFKCVMEGKQCALLCPTTVLAWQHYQTAVARMEGFPVNIELLSRFRSAKEKAEVLRKLEAGIVDFVIGTHTLVGKEVRFRDLGLVIIDEEQRFGVMQKEKLKDSFSAADVLTLSATPIPRTLNMAMSGLRDMSVIESPPHERTPVTTYVIEHDLGVIVGAVNKELRRAGQVYYIHNRVESIMSCAAKLQELIPQARIGIAHGKMDERALLETWRRLLEREIDVLVCTTLIETGVDVPNVNTLVIENADCMGLAQLHQLRGRVGRTNRRAYAYFTFRQGKVLSEIAEKRLKAVREFTQFGAGFRIALRDLELRGAGSVLGESQSGHLSSVGYETYVRLLEEAVQTMNNEQGTMNSEDNENSEHGISTVVDIKLDAFIPQGYITNQAQRIACYKRIAEIRDEDDVFDVIDELTDRYGIIPKPVEGLIFAASTRNLAAKLGIAEITQQKDRVLLYWEHPDMKRLAQVPAHYAKRIELTLTGRTAVALKLGKLTWNERGKWLVSEPVDDVMAFVSDFLRNLADLVDN
jgi:transcription-repair coupling factor (superfamily II helicase)